MLGIQLIDSFPHNNRRLDWFLVYSSSVHGISLQTLFRRWELLSENLPGHRNSPPSVFLIETTHGQVVTFHVEFVIVYSCDLGRSDFERISFLL